MAATLETYLGSLEWRKQKDLNWPRRDFDAQTALWSGTHCAEDGLAEFTDPRTQRRHYRLRLGDWIADVDFSWGCYAALAGAAREVFLYTGSAVLIPLCARLPSPIEVGLTLCSGFAPRRMELTRLPGKQPTHLKYRDVPQSIAQLAAAKVGQRLVLVHNSSEVRS